MNNEPLEPDPPNLSRRIRNHLRSDVEAWAVYLAFIVAVSGPFAARYVDNRAISAREEDRMERILASIRTCEERNNAWTRAMDYIDTVVSNHETVERLRVLGVVDCPDQP